MSTNIRGDLCETNHEKDKPECYFDVVTRGSIPPSKLSCAFFSSTNIQRLQNALRYRVFELSEGNAVISDQSTDELVIVMRGEFLQHAKNLPINIPGQIQEINGKVVDEMAPKILSEVAGHVLYLKDRFAGLEPLPPPVNVNSAGLAQVKGYADVLMGPTL